MTILFLDDIKKYPTAIYDTKTVNRSWVDIVKLYRSMGVKNHAFPLALINPRLQGVDPFDPMLSEELITMITIECKLNPWYYFREIARVPGSGPADKRMVQANRGNIYLWWSFFNHVFTILIQIRQTGKSFSVDQLTTYLMQVLCQNTKINLLTKDDKLRRENVERIKDINKTLPYYLNKLTRHDADNGEEFTVKLLDNWFKTHLPKRNKQDALNSGRGMTTPIMLIDEGPFQPNIRISLPAALAAMGAAREIAKENNSPYGVIMTTTAGKLNDDSGSYVYEFVSEAAVFDESYFDARNQDHLYELILANSTADIPSFNGTFSHRQLGKSDEWLKQRIAESRSKGEDAARDFLNKWTSGTSSSPFVAEVADRMEKSKKEPVWIETDPMYNYKTYWYLTKEQRDNYVKNTKFIIGLDTSEAIGNDFIGLIYLDPKTMNVVGTAMLNSISVYVFIEYVADLLEKYPNATLIPERKNTGVVLIDALMQILPERSIDPFKRIFNWIVQDPVTYERQMEEIKIPLNSRDKDIYVRFRDLMGYATSGSGKQSRERLFSETLNLVTTNFAERINDGRLVNQLLLLETKNGRIDHTRGNNDDLVIGWLLAAWLLVSGKNLQHYGINPLEIMTHPVQTSENVDTINKSRNEEQVYIRNKIVQLLERLNKETDPFISKKLENELMFLDSRLILQRSESLNMSELINKAKENKKRKHSNRDFRYSDTNEDIYRGFSKYQNNPNVNVSYN